MSTRVVLPSFNIRGRGPHPAVRALWLAGALVFVAMLMLGGALWHRYALDLAVRSATSRALVMVPEQQVRTMEPASAPSVRPAPAAISAAPAAADVPAAAPEAAAVAAPAAVVSPTPVGRHAGGRHHRLHASRSPRVKAVAAHGGGDGRTSKHGAAKKRDAVDKLLKQFK